MPAQGVWRKNMAEQAVRPSSAAPTQGRTSRWRTVDIVVTAVLGVAFGVVFWAWGLLWAGTGAAFAAFPPGQAFMYGVWLIPAVLAPLVVRKPGAGLFAELIAAIVSALLGSARPGSPSPATAVSAGRRRCCRRRSPAPRQPCWTSSTTTRTGPRAGRPP